MEKAKHRLIRFEVENVMKLTSFFVKPNGNVIIVGGANGAGKSAALHALAMLIGGKKFCPDEPIKKGKDTAKIEGETDQGLHLKRTFKRKGDSWTSSLTVRQADGTAVAQTRLSAMLGEEKGKRIFDPLEFLRLDDGKQMDALLDLTGKRAELERLSAQSQAAYDRRRDTSRDHKRVVAALAVMERAPSGTPKELVSAAALVAEIRAASRASTERDRLLGDLENAELAKDALGESINGLQEKLAAKLGEIAKLRAKVNDGPADEDEETAALEGELASIEETNRCVRLLQDRDKQDEEAARLAELSETLTAQITAAEAAKSDILAATELPVEGLTFDAHGLVYGDAPLKQASKAQQVWITTALALASHPEFAVVTIHDGSLLDEDSMTAMADLAEAFDAQIWIEDARASKDGATVMIEDGEVI